MSKGGICRLSSAGFWSHRSGDAALVNERAGNTVYGSLGWFQKSRWRESQYRGDHNVLVHGHDRNILASTRLSGQDCIQLPERCDTETDCGNICCPSSCSVWGRLACFQCCGAIRNIWLLNAVLETREHTFTDGWSHTACEVEIASTN